MITVNVYTHGGNMFQGQMTEHETTDLVDCWSAKRWVQPVLSLAMRDEKRVAIAFVRYNEIAAIDYLLGL